MDIRKNLILDSSRNNDLNKKLAIVKNYGANQVKRAPENTFFNINNAVTNTLGPVRRQPLDPENNLDQLVNNNLPRRATNISPREQEKISNPNNVVF